MLRIAESALHIVLTVNISSVSNTGRAKENSVNNNRQDREVEKKITNMAFPARAERALHQTRTAY
jgi:hypothetical protein